MNETDLCTLYVVVAIHKVHRLEEFVVENERSDYNQRAEESQTPKSSCTYAERKGSGAEFISDSVANSVHPYQRGDAQG